MEDNSNKAPRKFRYERNGSNPNLYRYLSLRDAVSHRRAQRERGYTLKCAWVEKTHGLTYYYGEYKEIAKA